MLRSLPTTVLSTALLVGGAACAPAKPEVKAPVAPAPKPPEVDPHRLCEVIARVEDSVYQGARAAVRTELEAAAAKDPKDRAAAFGALFAIDDDNARWKAFHADSEANPESGLGPLGECFVYASWKMPDQAEAPCAAAAEALGSAALVEVARGELAARRERTDEARAHYEQAIAADAGCVPARTGLARAEAAAGNAEAAVASLEAALSAWPQCFSCAAEKAALVEKASGIEAALPHWEAALAIVPDHPATLKRYAAALVGKDDGKALLAYEKAIARGRADFQTLHAAARLARALGQADKALDFGERASQAEADDAELWRLLASLYEGKNDVPGLEKAWGEVLRLLPQDPAAHLALARASKGQDRYVSALEHYEAAVAALAATTSQGASQELQQAAGGELSQLLVELSIDERGASGSVNRVVGVVQRQARKVFEARVKEHSGLKGKLDVVVVTNKDGGVDEVRIERDTLGDSHVAAAVLGNLRRAKISGGAKRYALELEFE